MIVLPVRTKGELLLIELLLKHLQHRLKAVHPDLATADRTVMLFAMLGWLPAAGEGDVDEAFLFARGPRVPQSR